MSIEGYQAAMKQIVSDKHPTDVAQVYATIAQAEILEALYMAFQISQGHGPILASEEEKGE